MSRLRFRDLSLPAALGIAAVLATMQSPAAAAQSMPFPPTRVVNVSVSFNTQVPLPDLSEQALADSQKSGRLSLYRLARDECDVMKTVIAEACQLTNINISTQIQNYNNGQPVMLYLNGNANFMIGLKPQGAE